MMSTFCDLCEEGKFKKILQRFKRRRRVDELKKGFNPHKSQPLHYAARHGNLQVVRELIERHGCDPDCKNVYGITPLHCASYCGHISVVKYLINKGCDPHAKDTENGECPLVYCMKVTTVTYTWDSKPPLNSASRSFTDKTGHMEVAIFLASASTCEMCAGDKLAHGMLRLLCDCGTLKDLNVLLKRLHLSFESVFSSNPLHYLKTTIYCKCWDVTKYLLTNFHEHIKHAIQQQCEQRYSCTESPFLTACASGNVDIVRLFVDLKISVPDATAAYHAIIISHTPETGKAIVSYFIESVGRSFAMNSCGSWDNSSLLESVLSYSRERRDLDLIKLIIRNSIDSRDNKGNTPLHLACQCCVVEIVEFLVERNSDQTALNDKSKLPLHVACETCDIKVVELVSSARDLDVNVQDKDGNTPLHIACKRFVSDYNARAHTSSIISYLVTNEKCNLNIQNGQGELALHMTLKSYKHCFHGEHKELCYRLLQLTSNDKNLSINAKDDYGDTPLLLACHCDSKVVQYLTSTFECDQDVKCKNCQCLPLHYACYKSLEMVHLVSSHCTQLHWKNSSGYTPLHIACKNFSLDIANYLVFEKGCKPSQHPEGYEDLQIHIACHDPKDFNLLSALATKENACQESFYGYDDNDVKLNDETPMHVACRNNNLLAIKLLKSLDCDLSCTDDEGNLPLHHASAQSFACVELLIPLNETDVNACNSDGNTPFHLACRSGLPDVIDYFLSNFKCDLTVTNNNGELPIHLACQNNSLKLVKMVMDHNLLSHKDTHGDTVLHIACRSGATDVVAYLVNDCKCSTQGINNDGLLPLHLACTQSLEMVETVLNDFNEEYLANSLMSGEVTPFEMACSFGQLDIVKYLSDLKCHERDVKRSALAYACGFSNYKNSYRESSAVTDLSRAEVTKFLVSKCGYDPSSLLPSTHYYYNSQRDSHSLFSHACVKNDLELMKALTDTSVDLLDADGNTPLHYTCQHNCCEIVQYLVEQGCDETIKNQKGDLALHIACRTSLKIVQLLNISDSSLVSSLNASGDTPLLVAVKSQKLCIVQYLIENVSCNVANIKDSKEESALHISCKDSLIEMVKVLQIISINSQNAEGNTPLHIACVNQKYNVVEYLLSDLRCKACIKNKNGDLPLHIAISQHQSWVKTPIQHVAFPIHIMEQIIKRYPLALTVLEKNGSSPLHEICRIGSVEILNFITTEISLDAPDSCGNTPLHIACIHYQKETIQWLINHGANPCLQNKDGNLPHHLLFYQKKEEQKSVHVPQRKIHAESSTKELIDILGINHVIMSIQNKLGDTILHLACNYNKTRVLQSLLNHIGCDTSLLSIQNASLNTPLHIAASKMECSMKGFLNGCDLNVKNKDENTPLHVACKSKNLKFVKMLLKMHCDPNISNKQKELPIHLAAPHSLALVKCVSCALPYVNSKNMAGDTPLHIASRAAKLDIVDYLIDELKCETGILNDNKELPFHLLCGKPYVKLIHVTKYIPESLIGTCNKDGDTPLHIACKSGNEAAVLGLVELNASINVQNNIGATPLHYACVRGSLTIVQSVHDCNPKHQICRYFASKYVSLGDTALHVACRAGNIGVARFLLRNKHKDALTVKNQNGDTPFHVACSNSLKVVKAIAECKDIFDLNAVNENQDTPLHIACKKIRRTAIVSFLVNELHCRCDLPNKDGDLPLHIACRNQIKGMIEVLVRSMDECHLRLKNHGENTALHELFSKPIPNKKLNNIIKVTKLLKGDMENTECNFKGELPIHLVCRNAPLRIIKCFDLSVFSPSVTNNGNTLLHEACINKDGGVLEYVIENSNLNANITNCDGDLPLHIACRCHLNLKHTQKIISCLLQKTSNVNIQNKTGNTPIHELYSSEFNSDNERLYNYYARLTILRLFLESKVNLSVQNDEHQTPLHCIYKFGSHVDLKEVLTHNPMPPIDATIQDAAGDTILHMMCQRNDNELVDLLMSSTTVIVDLSIKNKRDQTPLMLTNNYKIIKCLLAHDADPQPVYKMHETFFQKYSLEQPPPVPAKLLFVGHSGAGKTTLTLSLQSEGNDNTLVQSSGPTAGIVPTDFNSKIYGAVTMYDFAGHPEYYGSHDAIIHSTIKNIPPIILLLVNLTLHREIILDQIQFWSDFISNTTSDAHLIIIGSHADEVNDNPSELMNAIVSSAKEAELIGSDVALKGYFHMNCTQPCSKELHDIQMLLKQSTNEIRQEGVMHFNSHCFCVLLLDLFKDSNIVNLGNVITTIKRMSDKAGESPIYLLSSDSNTVIQMCEELNEMGYILFIKHPSILNLSWLVLKKELLLTDMLGPLFASSDLEEHFLSCSTGIVPMSHLREHFDAKYNCDMLLTFLIKMEFCREVCDKDVLELITNKESFSSSEKYYFFPSFVNTERPTNSWKDCSSVSHRCGWLLQCSRKGEPFKARFTQVLLLRIAFAFAFKWRPRAIETYADRKEKEESSMMKFVLKRDCKLWRNGIHWLEQSGIDAIIDIVNQRTLLLLMQCPQGSEVQLVKRRSQIISMVFEAKEKFCSKAVLQECFLEPSSVKHPLEKFDDSVMFSMESINDSIVDGQRYIIENHQRIGVDQLLYFEPYAEISIDIIEQLFDKANADQQVTNEIVFSLAHQLCHRYKFFQYLCHPSNVYRTRIAAGFASHSPERDSTHKLACLLMQIKHSPSGGTLHELRKLLDQLSIYCGRQPPQVERLGTSEASFIQSANTTTQRSPLLISPKLHEISYLSRGGKTVKIIDQVASDWEKVAIQLYFEYSSIRCIKKNNPSDCISACLVVFGEWLDGNARLPTTWDTLIRALDKADFGELAAEVKVIIQGH